MKNENIIYAMTKKENMEQKGFKTYENDAICVFWKPGMCTHSGKCVMGNNAVFDPLRRPWVDLSQADAIEIAAIIDRCPSKALQYELKAPIRIVFEEAERQAAAYDGEKQIGECQYSVDRVGKWVIMHTGVRSEYNGRGIARQLVEKVIEAARERGVKIVPVCSYAQRMMSGKDEYKDVL